jgi:cell wall assembly regulator SMI1
MDIKAQLDELAALLIQDEKPLPMPNGATYEDLSELEKTLNRPLSDDLKSLYQAHNGEFDYGSKYFVGLFFDYEFLSARHIVEIYNLLQRNNQYLDLFHIQDDQEYMSIPPKTVKSVGFDPGWIPIAGYFGGNYIGVDMNPGPDGTLGQIINFGRDDIVHFQIAQDIYSFIDIARNMYAHRHWHSIFEGAEWSLYDTLKRQQNLA